MERLNDKGGQEGRSLKLEDEEEWQNVNKRTKYTSVLWIWLQQMQTLYSTNLTNTDSDQWK